MKDRIIIDFEAGLQRFKFKLMTSKANKTVCTKYSVKRVVYVKLKLKTISNLTKAN